MLRVGVVGSGPTAFAALVALKKLGSEVSIDLFDAATGSITNPKITAQQISLQKQYLIDSSNKLSSFQLTKKFGVPFFSKGGWSNYWGTTFLPWTQRDIELMGYDYKEFASAYTEVAKNIAIQGSKDSEISFYPNYTQYVQSGQKSRIAQQILENHKRQIKRDSHSGYQFFESRLGVSQLNTNSSLGCIQCGSCLAGCPYGHIFNAYNEILKLNLRNLNEIFGTKITSITYSGEKISLHSGSKSFHDFDYVFVAAGVIQTALILSNSIPIKKLSTLETPMTLIPSFYFRKFTKNPEVLNSRAITLSEIFVSKISPKGNCTGSGQIYSMNPELRSKLGVLGKWIPDSLARRILITMYFFEPNRNNRIEIQNAAQLPRYTNKQKYQHRRSFREYRLKLLELGFVSFPINIFMRKKGDSYHFGGLFEQSSTGVPNRVVDNDGNLKKEFNLPNVYCVDASSLCEPRPGPITYSLMANAFRITNKVLGTKE